MFKKFLSFAELCAYVLGAIGGFGYCAYCKAWPVAVAVAVLAAMAYPEAKAAFRRLTE